MDVTAQPEAHIIAHEKGRDPALGPGRALDDAASTMPPYTNCRIKTTSRIITSTAMTMLMGLFIPTSPLK
jgi:hypothetical protein